MSAVWYTSDTHFMHRFLAIDIRRFSSIEEHDEALIDSWNHYIKPTDTVIHCGDFSLKKPEEFAPIFRRLNGEIHLIAGNHDRCFPGIRDSHKYVKQYYDLGFKSVQSFMRRKLDGIYFMVSHFPYGGDHTPGERYIQYRLRYVDLPIVHGHTHSSEVVSRYHQGTLQVHVGLEAWGLTPVHQEQLLEILKKEGAGT